MNDVTPSFADQDETLKIEPDDPQEPSDDSTEPDGVLILKIKDENGIATEVVPLGAVEATEIQTLIELGLQSWRSKIGLGR